MSVMDGSLEVKPFLRWAGSKRQLIPKLKQYWDSSYNRYIEPFMGSACLFFALQPKSAILSDLNSDLVNAFTCIKNNPKVVSYHLNNYSNTKSEYYRIRALDNDKISKFESAARLIYLNKYCFNGLYRINSQGKFNVPYGKRKKIKLPTRETLHSYSELLKSVDIRHCDFMESIIDAQQGDFVYMDPPYVIKKREVFKDYCLNTFNESDFQKLSAYLPELNSRGVQFVVSYADCQESRELSKHWNWRRVKTRRNIAGFIDKRRNAYELIITNKNVGIFS